MLERKNGANKEGVSDYNSLFLFNIIEQDEVLQSFSWK